MPSTALTAAIKEAYASAPSNVVPWETLQISHPLLPDGSLFLIKDQQDRTLRLEDSSYQLFKACSFNLTLPAAGNNGVQSMSISVDNVDRQASDFFETVKDSDVPVLATFRPYLSTDPNTPQMTPPLVLCLSDVEVHLTDVSAKASFGNLLNRPYPSELYTRKRFPSLGQ